MLQIDETSNNYDDDLDKLSRSSKPSESDSSQEPSCILRIQTAPARPLTEQEEFKRSQEFMLLEQIFITQGQLLQKEYNKYDLDSPEGQKICKKYLHLIEKLCEFYSVQVTSRTYRNSFSKAYKILYKDSSLCYLTEILDSAQEGFPYLWVNGEKYEFTTDVLEAGSKLIDYFFKLQHVLRHAYSKACQDSQSFSPNLIKEEITIVLEDFDYSWAKFEQLYVNELMQIEQEARRFIVKGIELEKELTSIEIREKMKGKILIQSEEHAKIKKKLCKVIMNINSVANYEGKGRDDLGVEILLEAEGLIRRVTNEQSKAVRNLAESIKNSFMKMRSLLRKYDDNIEMVDPQLKNNADLVEVLVEYESSWEKGKNYFLNPKKCNYLVHFSHTIEATKEKYATFHEQVDCRDADIFMTIPCVLILQSLENEDKQICSYFLPSLFESTHKLNTLYKRLKDEFNQWMSGHKKCYEYHNIIEKIIIGIDLSENETILANEYIELKQIIQKIKEIAIELTRNNATEWNSFIDAALNC